MSSIEEAIIEFAKSITTLAESNHRVADTNEAVVEKYERLIALQGGEAAPAPTKPAGKGGRPAGAKNKPKEEPQEDDGLGGTAPDSVTFDEMKAKLVELREATDVAAPRALMKKFGAGNVAEIKEEDYQAVYDAAVKAIKAA